MVVIFVSDLAGTSPGSAGESQADQSDAEGRVSGRKTGVGSLLEAPVEVTAVSEAGRTLGKAFSSG